MKQKSPDLDWTVSDRDDSTEARLIHEGLKEHVERQVGPSNRSSLVIAARDSAGQVLGGIRGFSHWNWMYISHVWVAESARSLGLGSELLKKAELEAISRGCRGVYVDTFDPRARDFYKRNGFEDFGAIPEFPPGFQRYYLLKNL